MFGGVTLTNAPITGQGSTFDMHVILLHGEITVYLTTVAGDTRFDFSTTKGTLVTNRKQLRAYFR